MTREFFHYTCSHGAEGIRGAGQVLPLGRLGRLSSLLPADRRWMLDVCWFTDLDEPDVDALGLTSVTLACNRVEWRATVAELGPLVKWSTYARTVVPRDQRDELEAGRRPAHWWVATSPVRVHAVAPVSLLHGTA